ncbi:hypothetical protein Leryth_002653 [Lithospermum erythrorhizon]|nr:hypothetical protein Leryth_002653 [Lithospermum erythrorhizon]
MLIVCSSCLTLLFFFNLLYSLCRKNTTKNKKTQKYSNKLMVGIKRTSEGNFSFFPGTMQGGEVAEDVFSMAQQYDFHHHQNDNNNNINNPSGEEGAVVVEMEPWNNNQKETNIIQEMVQENDDGNNILPYHDNSNFHIGASYHNQQVEQENVHQQGNYYQPTSELLNMFPLPTCTTSTDLLPNPSISLANYAQKLNLFTSLGLIGDIAPTAAGYDPLLLPLNLPPHPPMLNELFHTLPHEYYNTLGGNSRSGSLFCGVDNDEDAIMGESYQDNDGRPLTNGVFEFTSVGVKDGRKNTKPFATEKQRRVHLNDRYAALRNLIPNPSKNDRASIVGDAIRYIEELKRQVNELKFLVDKKRCAKERINMPKMEDGLEIKERKTENIDDQPYNGSSALREFMV